MYPDDARDPQLSDQQRLLRMLGLRPPPASPPVGSAPVGPAPVTSAPIGPAPIGSPPVASAPVGPAPVQRRQSWDPSGFVPDWHPYLAEEDEPGDYDDEADGYAAADEEYGYEEDGAEYEYEYADELPGARSWSGSQPRRNVRRKPNRGSPARFVLPVVAIIAIGFGATKLLAGRPGATLAAQGDSRTPTASTPAASAPAVSAAGSTAFTSFAAYSGQQSRNGGQLAVSSVAAADGEQLATGSADGHPAIWRRGQGTSWSLADNTVNGVLAGRPGTEAMTAVTHGPAGWLAVGDVVSGTDQHPVVVTSADGATWQAADGSPAFGAGGMYSYGVAAGQTDYVIVGEQVTGNRVTAATWWSAGLGAWTRGGNGGLDGRLRSSAMFAAAVGPKSFIAVGAHGSGPAVWTSPDGQQWTARDLPLPAGATSAVLRQVAVHGARVVATGNAVSTKKTVPFAEVSADGGVSWRGVTLPSSGNQAAVTALAAAGTGFVAAGVSGQSRDSAAIVWTSADGGNWTDPRPVSSPAGAKVQQISGLTSAGGTVTGIGVAATRLGERPVVYTAPVPGPSSPSGLSSPSSPSSPVTAVKSASLFPASPPRD